MDKENILQTIAKAKNDINYSLENAKLIKEGMDIQSQTIPSSPQECTFGKWFYTEGKKLGKLSNNPMECLQNIELLHEEFHRIYSEIAKIYEEHNNKGGLLGIFTKKKEIPNEKMDPLLEKLEDAHKRLLNELIKMERRIQATPQEKFNSIE